MKYLQENKRTICRAFSAPHHMCEASAHDVLSTDTTALSPYFTFQN